MCSWCAFRWSAKIRKLAAVPPGAAELTSVVGRGAHSYNNVRMKWVPEITHHAKGVPFVLVGTKLDLRDDSAWCHENGITPVATEDGQKLADSVGAKVYIECSALTQTNLKKVFDEAIRIALEAAAKEEVKTKKSKCAIL